MNHRGRIRLGCSLWLAVCAGCSTVTETPRFYAPLPVPPADLPSANNSVPVTKTAAHQADATAAPPVDQPGAKPAALASAPAQPSLPELLTELRTIGLDPQAEAQLIADLEQTDPAMWPQLVRLFRASIEYRRRSAAGAEKPAETTLANTDFKPAAAATLESPAVAKPNNSLADEQAAERAALEDANVVPASYSASHPSTTPTSNETPSHEASSKAAQLDAANDQVLNDAPTDVEDYRESLARTIRALEARADQPPADAREMAEHVHLRMLYLAAGRREDALRPISGMSGAEQDFWKAELFGISRYLEADRTHPGRRAAEAADHLAKALAPLQESGNLIVKNPAFCTEVVSYGTYTTFEKNEFHPGQQVLLYAEVENLKTNQTANGYHTSLKSRYQVLDAQGRRVAEQELPLTEEDCRNLRRDYFIRFFLWIPKRIYDGRYTLQLTVEDNLGQKIGQSSIEFTVKEPSTDKGK